MKICITSTGKNLTDKLDPRFGRCENFIIYDTDSDKFEAFDNGNSEIAGGAGVQTAQAIISKGVKAVISGSFGPNAFTILSAAGVDMYVSKEETIKEIIKKFKDGKLKKLEQAGPSRKN
jgi:predicted Fe-Mo cluster-binding NifX family protein